MAQRNQPNFLFLFPDQLRWDYLGCEGKFPVRTPNVDALAQRGVRFTQCRSNSPLCAPVRACIAAGRRYHRTDVPGNNAHLDPAMGTVFQQLRNAGYRIGTCGKCDLNKDQGPRYDGWTQLLGQYGFTEAIDHAGKIDCVNNNKNTPTEPYSAHLHSQGLMQAHFDDYDKRGKTNNPPAAWASPLPRKHYTDDFAGQNALELLDGFPEHGPWTLWVNFPGPHNPFDPPEELARRYEDVEFPTPTQPHADADPEQLQRVQRAYAACTEGIDDWVGWLIDAVERRGELENTVIIFASDHGEMLGDFGHWGKQRPEDPSARVPLVMAGPGIEEGIVSDSLPELIDISATMLDQAGLEVPEDWDARSLQPVLTGRSAEHREAQVMELGNWAAICDGRHKLVERSDAEPTLYDLANDPQELTNVAADQPEVVRRLSEQLARERAAGEGSGELAAR